MQPDRPGASVEVEAGFVWLPLRVVRARGEPPASFLGVPVVMCASPHACCDVTWQVMRTMLQEHNAHGRGWDMEEGSSTASVTGGSRQGNGGLITHAHTHIHSCLPASLSQGT